MPRVANGLKEIPDVTAKMQPRRHREGRWFSTRRHNGPPMGFLTRRGTELPMDTQAVKL